MLSRGSNPQPRKRPPKGLSRMRLGSPVGFQDPQPPRLLWAGTPRNARGWGGRTAGSSPVRFVLTRPSPEKEANERTIPLTPSLWEGSIRVRLSSCKDACQRPRGGFAVGGWFSSIGQLTEGGSPAPPALFLPLAQSPLSLFLGSAPNLLMEYATRDATNAQPEKINRKATCSTTSCASCRIWTPQTRRE